MRLIALLCCIVLAGCGAATAPTTLPSPESPPESTPQATEETLQATLEQTVKQALAQHLNISTSTIELVSVREQQWPSTALGCPEPGMMYAQKITPGWQIVAQSGTISYTLHTDTAASIILCDDSQPIALQTAAVTPTASAEESMLTNAQEIIQHHAQQFNVAAKDIRVVSEEEVTWSSSALGCAKPGQMYLTVLTPGFRVVLEHDGVQYAYHAGRDQRFFLCNTPETPVGS